MSAFKLTPTGELMSFLVGLNLPKGSQADEIRERGIAWLRQAPEDFSAREEDLRARIAELEGKLAEAEVLLHQWFGLFGFDGRTPEELSAATDAALSNTSPTAQALARLVEAVGVEYDSPHLASHVCEECEQDWTLAITLESHGATMEAYRAYQAARSGRREGQT